MGSRSRHAGLGLLGLALLAGAHATAAGENGVARARLTVILQYDASYSEHGTPPEQSESDETLHEEATYHRIILLKRVGDELIALDTPPEKAGAGDRPGGHAEIAYHAESQGSDGEISQRSNGAFHGVTSEGVSGGLAQYGGEDIPYLKWGVSITFHGALKGSCKTSVRTRERDSALEPFHWVTRTDDSCPGGMLGAGLDAGPLGPQEAKRDPSNNRAGKVDAQFTVLPESVHAAVGDSPDKWYGAKLGGNERSGYILVFDGTRGSAGKAASVAAASAGSLSKEHLHVVAELTPLSAIGCTLDSSMLGQAFDEALAARHIATPPEYLVTRQPYPDLIGYAIRLTADSGLLPTANRALRDATASGHLQAGAARMLVGSVQVAGGRYRAVARINDVSTAVVLQAGRGDGSGCERGLEQALARAISGLPLQSYHAH
jgi:hypothetical protein